MKDLKNTFDVGKMQQNVVKKVGKMQFERYINRKIVDETVNQQMIKLINLYTIVGGFPEAVDSFLKTNNLQNVYYVHETINKLYMMDISKYSTKDTLLIKDIYSLIPSELNNQNKRFILKNLNEKARFYQYEESLYG